MRPHKTIPADTKAYFFNIKLGLVRDGKEIHMEKICKWCETINMTGCIDRNGFQYGTGHLN